MGVKVTELRRKLRLLDTYIGEGTIEAIALKLDRKPGTVLGWGDGSPGAEPNTVPPRNFQPLLAALTDVLAGKVPPAQVETLFRGPASRLEAALREGSPILAMIEDEALRDGWVLFRGDADEPGLIEVVGKRQDESTLPTVALDALFRLVLEHDLRIFNIIAIQHAGMAWGPVPSDIASKTGHVLLPGYDTNGAPDWMCESHQTGRHSFIVFAARKPFPAELTVYWRDEVPLDRAALAILGDFYQTLAKPERRVFLCRLCIERQPDTGTPSP